ncbi:conserved hypothetical protein [Leishmania braziliensis MHOM/BR/75/M2904]|uniref:Uncharacterized protein n=2 Tax=Leishmania braziliensis TaxID=5660 RepID=A4HKK6_LEIBR|nr:conserved hypothetical protein [Leishmania braziliensis MHOM/BR/75/M2904]CAJ2478683.1 unnamed protein product [Leishmania braziliensis]CAM43032.1 conserved hypothetical protein [Leishmania braziliensis MHOM/BR/75/M2904]SYZ68737.1 hypothetical_protein [Leishmania braziliensis MHOM/BR/75/M2904]
MEVNIRAFSDALDGILAAKTSSSQTAHSAALHKKPFPFSQSCVDHSQNKCSKPAAPEAFQASLSNNDPEVLGDAASVIEPSMQTEKPIAPQKKPTQQLQASPSNDCEKTFFLKEAERKNRSPKIAKFHKRENLPLRSATVKSSNTTVEGFLEHLKSAELVAFKVVEATGVGIGSALLTPQNVRLWMSRSQLPSKSWVTCTSFSHEACAVFELENRADMRKRRELLSYTHNKVVDLPAGGSTDTYVVQDLVAVLVVEDDIERPSLHLDSAAFPIQERHVFSVVIETSSSRHGGFLVLTTTSAAPSCVTSLKVPGTQLNTFLKITISPLASEARPKLIKVRAVCFFRSDTWTTERVIPLQKDDSSLKEGVEAVLQEGAKTTRRSAHSISERRGERCAAETEPTQSPLLSLKGHRQAKKSEGVAHLASLDHDSGADVADFVKAIALASSRQDNAAPEHSSSCSGCSVEYDWFLDRLVDVSASKDNSKDNACRKANLPDAGSETGSEAPVQEYIRTLQAWNAVPALSMKSALTYCLCETTSFSASTIFATKLFGYEAQNHLSQPFKLHFFVVSNFDDIDQSSEQVRSSGVHLPPVHFLSAVASQAASLGYTTELLFTCPANNGFGCALRPHSCTSGSSDAHCKLIFVVPAHCNAEMNEGGIASVTKCLLRTALSIFCESADKRGSRLRQDCAFSRHSTMSCTKPCGALRLLIDGTCCFDDLIPVFAEWAEVSGSLRYYGSASQRTLQLLFSPSLLTRSSGGGEQLGDLSELRREAQWSGLNLRLSGLWRRDINEGEIASDNIVALEANYYCPATYVWQSRRGTLRLVLTDSHFMEYLLCVDGLVAPSPLVSLATSYYGKEADSTTHTLSLTTLSEAPWMMLLQTFEKVRKSPGVSAAALSEGAAADFLALRRHVTVSFAFHILSTAFKRGWARVSASIPLCDGHIRDAAVELQNVHGASLEKGVNGGGGVRSSLGILDEDAFMDTLLQWQYPFPNVVVLHCTDVLHPGPTPSPALTGSLCTSSSGVQEGVLSLFSEEVLHSFAFVPKLDEALSLLQGVTCLS